MQQGIKQGDKVLYREDGSEVICEVLSNTSEEGIDRLRLKAVEVMRQPWIGLAPSPGEEFDVWQRNDSGSWIGMWSVKLIVVDGEAKACV